MSQASSPYAQALAPDSPTPFDPSNQGYLDTSDPSLCPFCHIAATYPSYDPAYPPPSSDPSFNPEATHPNPSTFLLLSTPHLIAFLDIMPLSPGHLLLCPRSHRLKLTDITASEAAHLGRYLRVLSAALVCATGIADWNVVQNNGAAAAQVVPHMHFHLIPRPELRATGQAADRFTTTMFGRGQREDLDEEGGNRLAGQVRECVRLILKKEMAREKL